MQIGEQSCISSDHDLCHLSTFSGRNNGICYHEKVTLCGGREEKPAENRYILFLMCMLQVSVVTMNGTEAFQADLMDSVAITIS